MSSAPLISVDAQLREYRLAQLLRVLIPIFGAYALVYAALGIWLAHPGLSLGAVSLCLLLAATLWSRQLLRAKRVKTAALWVGYATHFTTCLSIVAVHFLVGPLLFMQLGAFALVYPTVHGAALKRFVVSAVVAAGWLSFVALGQPLMAEPPVLLQRVLEVTGTVATAGMVVLLLWVDAIRLRQSLEQARGAVRLRDEFLLIASHELESPLKPLNHRFERLHSEVSALEDSVAAERLSTELGLGQRQVQKLSALVRDLLEVARLGQGKLPIELDEVDLCDVVRQGLARFAPAAKRAACEVRLLVPDGPVLGEWDGARLKQLLECLVSNAIKFGVGKPVEIEVGRKDGEALLRVTDHGIGLSEETRQRLFGKFERGETERHYGSGLGLGLFLSRRIIEAMNGRIAVSSEPGQGTTFEVSLPLNAHVAVKPAAQQTHLH